MKHYLRGEDGVNWDDYHGVLPASFARYDEIGYNTQHTTTPGSYSATRNSSATVDGSLSGRTSPESPTISKPDATKRVRAKRSKQQLSGQTTPLLSGTYRSVEFHPYADEASLPLPLVSVICFPSHVCRTNRVVASPMSLRVLCSTSEERASWRPSALPVSYLMHRYKFVLSQMINRNECHESIVCNSSLLFWSCYHTDFIPGFKEWSIK